MKQATVRSNLIVYSVYDGVTYDMLIAIEVQDFFANVTVVLCDWMVFEIK